MRRQKSQKPMRRCIACYKSYPQDELIRFTLKDGEIIRDNEIKKDGRGMYLCNKQECFDIAINKKAFNRVCRMSSISFKEEYNVEKN